MELSNFVGKIVVGAKSNRRYVLHRIAAPYIVAVAVETDARGNRASYRWTTMNGDPISTGLLFFEDASLAEPFIAAYNAYCRTQEAYYEEIGYWMRKD